MLYFVLEALIALVQINDKNRTNNKALIRGLIWCIGLISYGLLFFTNEKISPDLGTLFVLIGLTCAGAAVFSRRCAFRVEKTDVYLLFCAVYASFVSFGQRFFLDGNTRIHGSIEGTFYLLIGVHLVFSRLLNLFLFWLEYLADICAKKQKQALLLNAENKPGISEAVRCTSGVSAYHLCGFLSGFLFIGCDGSTQPGLWKCSFERLAPDLSYAMHEILGESYK